MIGNVKFFDSNKIMSLKVIDIKLLKKYTKTQERISILMNIEFDSEPVHGDNDKYIKIKIMLYGDKVNTKGAQFSSQQLALGNQRFSV